MSEQEEAQTGEEPTEAVTTDAAPEQQQEPEAEKKPEPTGKEYIDFDKIPEDMRPVVEARFKRLYGHVKESNRALEILGKNHKAVLERLEKLETGDLDNRISDLQAQQRQAYEEGDFAKAQQISDSILDHKLASRNKQQAEEIEVPEFKEEESGPLSENQMAALGAWAKEKGDDGSPVRPWAAPGHPDNARAIQYIQAASMDPDLVTVDPATGEITNDSFKRVLREVDQRMNGKSRQPTAAAVLSGNSDSRPAPKDKTPRLSPEEIRVAEQMGYDPKDYAKLMTKYGVR